MLHKEEVVPWEATSPYRDSPSSTCPTVSLFAAGMQSGDVVTSDNNRLLSIEPSSWLTNILLKVPMPRYQNCMFYNDNNETKNKINLII